MKSTTRADLRRSGFTLVELLVVIGIIVILSGMSLMGFQRVMRLRDDAKTRVQITLLATALDGYKATYGVYPPGDGGPTSTAVLRTELFPAKGAADGDKVFLPDLAPTNNQGWGGTGPVVDPFKNNFRYRSPGTRNVSDFDLWSLGHDGVEGTGDDITNWTN